MSSWIHLIFWLTLVASALWLWHALGVREQALRAVRRYCTQQGITLLDDQVAFHKLNWRADAQNRRHLAWTYRFEYTLTGMQRLTGEVLLWGHQLQYRVPLSMAEVDLAIPANESQPPELPAPTPESITSAKGQIVCLDDWRKQHPKPRSSQD